ncbi:acyl-CoA dehydrogenase domain protein [Luminiphilus syltensis NOR5-1B]|uniref:Acyl-CoA dehydrogenase domain protein n=1 Tax=Luminiphilus syltensis NOR5-1B TaxID=565045 RepID=B8KUH4_9GAMM|nr:acyl-CoA dehydrogenase family protein [Luminiphilus syltensis]EED34121.1 acyl-CoA dehydrogenase domain protein [Luminiphilus syltensis NOR5-1B]
MITPQVFNTTLVDTADHHSDLRQAVAKLTGRFGRKYFQDIVARGEQPRELWAELGSAGFLGAHIPESHGGSGGGLSDLYIVIEETAAQGCPMLSLVISSICAPIIERFGSTEMKDYWLPGVADGSKRIAFAITEPDAGSNTHQIKTTATKIEDGWVLNGAKYWTSAIDDSESVMVVARDAELSTAERSALSLFIIPTNTKGLSWKPIEAALSSNDKQFMTFYDDVKLPNDALVGERGAGLKQVFVGLNPERVSAAAINNGISRFALEQAAQYAKDRNVWGKPIGAHQGVAHPLAEAYIAVQEARLMAARASQLFDLGEDAAEAANMAKFAAAESSLKALDQAMQVHGGNGLALEYGLADLWFIARLHKTAPVSREMILNHVGQHSLGLPKSY